MRYGQQIKELGNNSEDLTQYINGAERIARQADAELTTLRTELGQARAEVEAAKKVVDVAVAWRENMQHGRDHTDEGYSHPRDQDVEALADAVDDYLAARTAKPDLAQQGGEGE